MGEGTQERKGRDEKGGREKVQQPQATPRYSASVNIKYYTRKCFISKIA